MKTATDTAVSHRLDSRWPFLLIGLISLLAVGVVWLTPGNRAFLGELQTEKHAVGKRKAEIDKRFHEGVSLLNAKEYTRALAAFHRVLDLAPEMPEAHVNMGYALLGLGKASAARDFFESATVLRPDQMNAYFGMGEALQMMGDNLGALQSMETYLHRAAPNDPFRIKAEAAVWELRAAMQAERPDAAANAAGNAVPAHARPKH